MVWGRSAIEAVVIIKRVVRTGLGCLRRVISLKLAAPTGLASPLRVYGLTANPDVHMGVFEISIVAEAYSSG